MWYVYAIRSEKNGQIYIGLTEDLRQRLKEHNSHSGGHTTSRLSPLTLIFYEAFLDKTDAAAQEKFYKTGYGREVLRQKLVNYLNTCKVAASPAARR